MSEITIRKSHERLIQVLGGYLRRQGECDHSRQRFNGVMWVCKECGKKFEVTL